TGSDQDARYALFKLLQRGTVTEYESEFLMLIKQVAGISESLLKSFYISRLKPLLQCALLRLAPTTLGEAFSIARIMDARFEAIAEKEQNIKEKVDTTLSLPSDEASHVVKGRLDASQDTLLFLRSEDPNFKIQENGVKYVRALNVVPLEVVFTGPVDEVSSVIEDVFDIGESNVVSIEVRSEFSEFLENKESVEEVVVGGGEACGVGEYGLNIVISPKDGDGEFDDRLNEINLDLSHEFVTRVLENRDVFGESLVELLNPIWVPILWGVSGFNKSSFANKDVAMGKEAKRIWDPGIKIFFRHHLEDKVIMKEWGMIHPRFRIIS
ncbi:hypothetical protein Tco_1422775, partial [Tanacetum coccineum]